MNKTEAEIPDSQPKDNKPNQEKAAKRNREDKHRKKDDKSVAHVLKALSSLESTEEKLGAMCQKYAEMFNDHRILQDAAKVAERKNSILQKEKEQLQAEHSKAILTRSRLENLCRELQRQNKAVKEECMLKIREEEEKKREVAAKFHSTLTELGNLLAQNNDKNAKLRDDNLDMTTKLKNVCEQYEKKEQHVEKMAKQMHLEMQLANTKLAKAKMEMALEKESLLRDNQQLLLELKEYKKQLEEMKTSEIALRSQIQLYNDKYDEFHKALLQSNEAIGSFKQEMERMAKQIRKLEKETVAWKHRYETTHRTLLQMTEEKIKSDETASVSERRLTALQGLCRSLQAQCNHLRGVVKAQEAAGNVATPQPEMEETTEANPPLSVIENLSESSISNSSVEENIINDTTVKSSVTTDSILIQQKENITEDENAESTSTDQPCGLSPNIDDTESIKVNGIVCDAAVIGLVGEEVELSTSEIVEEEILVVNGESIQIINGATTNVEVTRVPTATEADINLPAFKENNIVNTNNESAVQSSSASPLEIAKVIQELQNGDISSSETEITPQLIVDSTSCCKSSEDLCEDRISSRILGDNTIMNSLIPNVGDKSTVKEDLSISSPVLVNNIDGSGINSNNKNDRIETAVKSMDCPPINQPSSQIVLPANQQNQQQGKKNKGKRKKSGPMSVKLQ